MNTLQQIQNLIPHIDEAGVCTRSSVQGGYSSPAVGTRFGHLVVLRRLADSRLECRCDCGSVSVKTRANLPRTSTCGYQCPIHKAKRTTHGMTHRPVYLVWAAMVQRCTNPKDPAWSNYGGRGITVCEEWLHSDNFFRDMLPTYRKGLTLDRVDNDAGYCKENCRWITFRENLGNRRNSVCPTWALDEAKRNGIPRGVLYRRLKLGWDPRRACVEPPVAVKDWASSIPDWVYETAAKNGIRKTTLLTRVYRGWTLQRACHEPTNS